MPMSGVFARCNIFEVFNCIIKFIPINMVDNQSFGARTQKRFCNKRVNSFWVENSVCSECINDPVSRTIDGWA